ncbi:MAG: TRAP transporter large permease subunit [Deltaproteobacteria bacterium]|nr:TRAP transporter large permease subunit [Deltaproteobacteria bacterium]
MPASTPTGSGSFLGRVLRVEHGFSVLVLAAMVILTLVGAVTRWVTGQGVAGLSVYVQSLNLWIALAGASLASRVGRHLALSSGSLLDRRPHLARTTRGLAAAVSTAVTALLAWASLELVIAERASNVALAGGIPVWLVECALPIGFLVMAFRLAWHGNTTWKGRVAALLAVGLAASMALIPPHLRAASSAAGIVLLLAAVALGAPLFTALGGVAMLLFFGEPVPTPISSVPAETYAIVSSPTLPTIPLFTLAGYLLAEGGASKRLVRLFRAWFGWIPGGTAAAAVGVCAFFTTFTGASGVTILALGGLLLPILLQAGYPERFAIGLLTASGSIGLLLPPSLTVILYGVVANVAIDDLYLAGAVPGILLIVLLVGAGLLVSLVHRVPRSGFDPRDALAALWDARWEVPIPFFVIGGIFGGYTTILEAAALTAAYAFVSEVLVHRDLSFGSDVPRVFVETATIVGGVLVVLGMALGFTNFLIDAEIPMRAAHWVQAHVESRLAFILLLNLFLLVVGCLMDVFSAIVVVVPLIAPMGLAFGLDPLHLGIIFLANLELGYLTPPVGMNLFLASYRFERPLVAIYRTAVPFLLLLGLGVVLISYVPALTTSTVAWMHRGEEAKPSADDVRRMLETEEPLPSAQDLMQELETIPER